MRAFCAGGGGAKPIWVAVDPAPKAEPNPCFFNVEDVVDGSAGSQVFGWIIWERPGVRIEAEPHSVWVSAQGDTLDVTPKPDGERTILFLPDERAAFDYARPNWRPSIRKALHGSPAVREVLDARTKYDEFVIRNSHPAGPRKALKPMDPILLHQFEALVARVEATREVVLRDFPT